MNINAINTAIVGLRVESIELRREIAITSEKLALLGSTPKLHIPKVAKEGVRILGALQSYLLKKNTGLKEALASLKNDYTLLSSGKKAQEELGALKVQVAKERVEVAKERVEVAKERVEELKVAKAVKVARAEQAKVASGRDKANGLEPAAMSEGILLAANLFEDEDKKIEAKAEAEAEEMSIAHQELKKENSWFYRISLIEGVGLKALTYFAYFVFAVFTFTGLLWFDKGHNATEEEAKVRVAKNKVKGIEVQKSKLKADVEKAKNDFDVAKKKVDHQLLKLEGIKDPLYTNLYNLHNESRKKLTLAEKALADFLENNPKPSVEVAVEPETPLEPEAINNPVVQGEGAGGV